MLGSQPYKPLNHDRLSDLYGDDMDYAAEMFGTFLNEVLPDFDAFDGLIEEEQWTEVHRLAHKLKPTLGLVGLCDLESAMNDIESAAVSTNPLQIRHMWHDFRASLSAMRPILHAEWQRFLRKQN